MQQGYAGPGMGPQYMQPPMGVPGMMQVPYGAMPVSTSCAPVMLLQSGMCTHGIYLIKSICSKR